MQQDPCISSQGLTDNRLTQLSLVHTAYGRTATCTLTCVNVRRFGYFYKVTYATLYMTMVETAKSVVKTVTYQSNRR